MLAASGIAWYSQMMNQSARPDALQQNMTNLTENGTDSIPATAESRYVLFSPEVLSATAHTRRVLFFYANWCPTCRPADARFTEDMSQIPSDVTLIRVNYNDTDTDQAEKDLARQYGITYQHTFVQIDGDGAVVTQWNGGQIDELNSNLK